MPDSGPARRRTLVVLIPVSEGTLFVSVDPRFVVRGSGSGITTPGKRKIGPKRADETLREAVDASTPVRQGAVASPTIRA